MLNVKYAVDMVQRYLIGWGIRNVPENAQFILDVMAEKAKEFLGDTASISSHATITTQNDVIEYPLPDSVVEVTQVVLEGYRIVAKITDKELKLLSGDIL